MKTGSARATILGAALLAAALPVATAPAAAQSEPRRILVTLAQAYGEPLTAVELDLRVAKKPAEVTRVYQPQERAVQLALLVDDSTGPEVASSLPALAGFLRSLPAGSEVLVAYVRGGSLEVVQPFTENREAGAAALRAPSGSTFANVGDLGQVILDALESFPATPRLRGQVLYLGEAQAQSDPYQDVTLNRAIALAQQKSVAVWVIRARTASQAEDFAGSGRTRQQAADEKAETQTTPGAGVRPPTTVQGRAAGTTDSFPARSGETEPPPESLNTSQALLQRLATETGGRAYAPDARPASLEPFLEKLRSQLNRQYFVEFTPPADKNGQPVAGKLTIALRGRKEAKLLYPAR
jgi:hypothetical protein